MPSPWMSLKAASDFAEACGAAKDQISIRLQSGEIHAIATDLREQRLESHTCNLDNGMKPEALYVGSNEPELSFDKDLRPLELGEHPLLAGDCRYTVIRGESQAVVYFGI